MNKTKPGTATPKIIHATDLHIGLDGDTSDQQEMRLRACIDEINRFHNDAELVVLTGDLAHHGSKAEYLKLRSELQRLDVPYRLLLGNHDRRDEFRSVFGNFYGEDGEFVQGWHDCAAGRLIFLDTADELLEESQIEWLRNCLRGVLGRRAYVFMHHPPFPIGLPALDALHLSSPDRLNACLAHEGNVAHLFFGHVHRIVHGHMNGFSYSGQRGLAPRFTLDFNGSTLCTDTAAPGYGVALLRDTSVVIHDSELLVSTITH